MERIKAKWIANKKYHLLPSNPTDTLNTYTSIIKSQGVFNMHNNILTIAFFMTVVTLHCLPNIALISYCCKRKEIAKEVPTKLTLVEKTMLQDDRNYEPEYYLNPSSAEPHHKYK